jgi:hypothetical protein
MDDGAEPRRRHLPRWPRAIAYGALFVVLAHVFTPDHPASNGDPDAAAANNIEIFGALVGAVIMTGLAVLLIEAALRNLARR